MRKTEGYMSRSDFKIVKDVPVEQISLDVHNARIRAGHDQGDCVQRILRKEDQLLALAADIAENGLTTAPILVSPAGARKYIVKDGNRRIAALKLLNDPGRWSPDARLKAKFEAIRLRFKDRIPAVVDVLSSPNEAAIIREVLARHSGAADGVGQLDWSAYLRTVYLVTRQLPATYKRPGQYAFWAEDHDINVGDEFPITSLQRFFSKENLARLGFDIDDKDELKPNIRIDVVKKMATTVLGDFESQRVRVADVFEPADATNYITRVRTMHGLVDAPPPSTTPFPEPGATPAPAPPTGGGPSPAPAPAGGSPASTSRPAPSPRQAPADRNRVFGRASPGIGIPSTETKAATIVTELRKLDLNETPFAAAMLLRALIELSDAYYRKGKIADKGKLAKNVRASAEHMRSKGMLDNSQFDIVARLATDANGLIEIESLQKMVHRDTHHLDKRFVNTFWDNVSLFVQNCWRK